MAGSLLVSAAQFGGYVCGADIDFLMIHGKTRPVRPNQKVEMNLHKFHLPWLTIVVTSHRKGTKVKASKATCVSTIYPLSTWTF